MSENTDNNNTDNNNNTLEDTDANIKDQAEVPPVSSELDTNVKSLIKSGTKIIKLIVYLYFTLL